MKKLFLLLPLILFLACNSDEEELPDESNTVVDIDGNTYDVVTIGTQTWMAENLKTTKFGDGTEIPLITGTEVPKTPAYFWYDDIPSNGDTYGALYNWYVLDTRVNGGKNVCPTGWHVPSDTEWTVLTDFLGGEIVAGDKLKEEGTDGVGFKALMGGGRDHLSRRR